MYAAVLVDVKKSKTYGNRERSMLQERIDVVIRCLNDMYGGAIVKEVGFSGGDEIQGLFRDPVSAYMYYRLLSLVLGVGVFRCGIGVGDWDVRLGDRTESAAQDGEAYHLAREAIGEAARSDYYDLVCRTRRGNGNDLTVLLDHSWGLCKMRTDLQNEIALVAELFYPLFFGNKCDATFIEGCRWHAAVLLDTFGAGMYERGRSCSVVEGLLCHDGISELGIKPTEAQYLETCVTSRGDTLVGAARDIAKAAGVSHQGVGRKIAQGRLIQERRAIALANRFYLRGR